MLLLFPLQEVKRKEWVEWGREETWMDILTPNFGLLWETFKNTKIPEVENTGEIQMQ